MSQLRHESSVPRGARTGRGSAGVRMVARSVTRVSGSRRARRGESAGCGGTRPPARRFPVAIRVALYLSRQAYASRMIAMPSTPRTRLRTAPLNPVAHDPGAVLLPGPPAAGTVPVNGAAFATPEPPRPPYARVKQYLKDALEAGRWAPGEQMPSEADLVAQFKV